MYECTTDGNDVRTAGYVASDVLFNVLSHPYCRYALAYLHRCSYPADVSELARVVAERAARTGATGDPGESTERIHTTLKYVHLPKMADRGLVEYDVESQLVILARGGVAERLERHLWNQIRDVAE